MKTYKPTSLNWLTALVGGVILILRKRKPRYKLPPARLNEKQNNSSQQEASHLQQLELQIHLAEYDALLREHELLQKMRQELGIYTLAGTVALIGAFIGQMSLFTNPNFLEVFLVIPIFFTLMTWWYVRTNYSAAVIELYVLTKLRPTLSRLVGSPVLGWIGFLYDNELSGTGKIIVGLQTISRAGLIQGPALLSLVIFFLRRQGDWKTWYALEYILIISNLLGILISLLLMLITKRLIWSLKR
jgi:hypothetical protein